MNFKSTKEIWDYLKSQYKGCERTKAIQVLNLGRKFEMQSMKETTTIKGYVDRLLSIANKVQCLGKHFPDERIVQRLWLLYLKSMNQRYQHESKDLSTITWDN